MRLRARIAVALLAASGIADAQTPYATTKATIGGIVVAADSNQPVARAKVTLSREDPQFGTEESPSRAAVTDLDGRFRFTEVDAGTYTLNAERNGYVLQGHRTRSRQTTRVALTAGREVTTAVLRLVRAGSIRGKVVDENGEPLSAVNVAALQYRYPMGRKTLSAVNQAQTDDLGEYRLYGLQPGRYYVATAPPPRGFYHGQSVDPAAAPVYAPLYYPDASSRAEASTIDVRAGSEYRADFRLTPTSPATVQGSLVGAFTGENATSQVTLFSEDGISGVATAKPDGSFEITGVLPGRYTLSAVSFSPGGERSRTARETLTVVAGGLDDVQLSLTPMNTELNGHIRVSSGTADLDRLMVTLVPHNGTEGDLSDAADAPDGRGGAAMVGKDGSFTIFVAAPGTYDLWLTTTRQDAGLEDWYTRSIEYGGEDVMATGMPLSGAPFGNVEMTIAPDGARIEGTVVDDRGKPVSDATVVAVPDPPLRQRIELYQPAQTDHAGRFLIRGQRPGTYKLYAWSEIDEQEYYNPEFLSRYEQDGVALHTDVNGHQQVVLRVIYVGDVD